jgi:hypothetical protein
MAFRITKAEADRREELVKRLEAQWGVVEDSVREYNEAVQSLREPVENALNLYNEIVQEARGFADDIANEHTDAFDDKSERWQDSETGEAVREWVDEWQNVVLEEIAPDWPADLDITDPENADALGALSSEPTEE